MNQRSTGIVVNVVALEIHPRFAPASSTGEFVVVGVATGFHHRPSTHVRAADAQHSHGVDLVMNAIGNFEDTAQLGLFPFLLVLRQLLFGQPEESCVKRLLRRRDFAAGVLLRIRFDHLGPQSEQVALQTLQLRSGNAIIGIDTAGRVKG